MASLWKSTGCYNETMSETIKKKYAIGVIPLIPLPLSREPSFTYEYPDMIALGSLVRIPFGKRSIQGIVTGGSELTMPLPFRTRPVSAIIAPEFLTPLQIRLAQFIGESSLTPLSIVLRHFIPKQVSERKKPSLHVKKILPIPDATPSIKKILRTLAKTHRHHILTRSTDEKLSLILALATKTLKTKDGQMLILVPDILLARELLETCGRFIDPHVLALITSTLSDGAYFTYWEAIRSGEARIIIGTRQSLFAPFQNLDTVFLDFDGHDGYKQWDMMPRYEGRAVAGHLATLHNARFITASPTESLQVLAEHEAGEMTLSGESIFDDVKLRDNIILSDLKLDRYKKNFSPFSLLTLDCIRDVLKRGRQILLIVNRQGTSIFSVCERCKNVLRCPQCERALVGTSTGSYRCLRCAYHTKEFPTCPSCGGLNFKNMGFGTEKLERDLRRLFAHTRIRRLDASSRRLKQEEADILSDAHAGSIDILIGTEAALLAPSLPKLDLIVILDGDNALRFPDYQAEERLLRSLGNALMRVSRETSAGKLIIQTFHSEHALFRALTEGTLDTVLDTLKQDRQLFSYPPYGIVIKCALQDTDEQKIGSEIHRAKGLLETAAREAATSFSVSDPVIPLAPKIRGEHIRFIIIRVRGLVFPEPLRKLLGTLSSQGFTIDRNPLSLS